MIAKKLGHVGGVVVAVGGLQALEKSGHRLGVEARTLQQIHADAVGLLFVGAGEVERILLLAGCHGGNCRLTRLR